MTFRDMLRGILIRFLAAPAKETDKSITQLSTSLHISLCVRLIYNILHRLAVCIQQAIPALYDFHDFFFKIFGNFIAGGQSSMCFR